MAARDRRPKRYTSKATLFGLPLVSIVYPRPGDPKELPRVAKGWIAMGDVAIGVLALGGVAMGVVACGGLSIGLASVGGLALGGIAMAGVALGAAAVGGLTVGVLSAGGASVGYGASGGVAVGVYASGAMPSGRHIWQFGGTPHPEALRFFDHFAWYFGSPPMSFYPPAIAAGLAVLGIAALVLLPVLLRLVVSRSTSPDPGPFDSDPLAPDRLDAD